jgi:succinyl-diaminopimelate desuccinylase
MSDPTTVPSAAGPQVDDAALVAFTRDLVRIRSVHDPEAGTDESVAAAFVAGQMRGFGWQPEIVEVVPGRPNVVAVVEGGGGEGPTLGFEGHTDVVTEGDHAEWRRHPFAGEIVGGRLYGRGAADMKAGVASMLFGVRALQDAGPFPGRVVLIVLCDEEGMMRGAKHFVTTPLAAEIDACIVCEPEGDEVCVAARGSIRIRLEFTGRMAHGAMPQRGANPLFAAAGLIAALPGYQAELQERHPAHEHLGPVHLTPTVVGGGSVEQVNVIPATAEVYLDVRLIPGVDHGAVVARVGELAARAGEPLGVTARLELVDDRPSVEIDPEHPVVRAVRAAHREQTGVDPELGGVPGATDGTILWRDAGIPNVVYGPGDKWIAHQVDEYVDVADLGRYARIYARAARAYLTGAAGGTG